MVWCFYSKGKTNMSFFPNDLCDHFVNLNKHVRKSKIFVCSLLLFVSTSALTSQAVQLSDPAMLIFLRDDLRTNTEINKWGTKAKQQLTCLFDRNSRGSQWWCHSSESPVHHHHAVRSPVKLWLFSDDSETRPGSSHDPFDDSPWNSPESNPRHTQ